MEEPRPRLSPGMLVGTPAALAALQSAGVSPQSLLDRHLQGDFGHLDAGDVQEQKLALHQEHDPEHRQRIMSVYPIGDNVVVWIITEADRSSTCILLPHEY